MTREERIWDIYKTLALKGTMSSKECYEMSLHFVEGYEEAEKKHPLPPCEVPAAAITQCQHLTPLSVLIGGKEAEWCPHCFQLL